MNKKYIGIGAVVVMLFWLIYLTARQPSGTIVERIEQVAASPLGGISNLDILNVGPNSLSQATSSTVTSGFDNNGLFESVSTGTCADATSTLFAVKNPFRATSTANAIVDISQIGTTSLAVGANTGTVYLSVATGTPELPGDAVNYNPQISANTTGGFPSFRSIVDTLQLSRAVNGGKPFIDSLAIASSTVVGTTTGKVAFPGRAVVGAFDSVVGFVTGSNIVTGESGKTDRPVDAVTNANNTFTCTYKIRFYR